MRTYLGYCTKNKLLKENFRWVPYFSYLPASLVLIGGIFSCLVFVYRVEAWEIATHVEFTSKAIESIEPEFNDYLIANLGLEDGLAASLPGGTPQELLKQGSDFEDNWPRFFRHFHDPISNSGLGGVFDSATNWSLKPIGDQEWSWNDAREYYFKALTSPTKAERDEYWGKTFRALGQVMHLIQDSANPAHVRDDPHILRDGLHDFMARRSVASYVGGGIIGPDPSLLEVMGAVREEPISNLFDRNVYNGANPETTLGATVGVTEYANANFFSDDRIAGQNSPAPPHPSLAELIPASSPSPYLTLSRLGSANFPGARVARYTGNETLTQFLNLEFDLLGKLRLDDAVYDAYATHLIPRAVGYSAAVLDYFFRGDVETTAVFHVVSHFVALLPGGGVVCDETPVFEWGHLEFGFDVPASLGYDGMTAVYYDDKNKNRIKIPEESFGVIPLNQIPANQPVPWYVVLDGPMGPGAKEERAIVAKKHEAEWVFSCDH